MKNRFITILLAVSIAVTLFTVPTHAATLQSGTSLTNMWLDPEFKNSDVLKSVKGDGSFSIETDNDEKNWVVAAPGNAAKAKMGFILNGYSSISDIAFKYGNTYSISFKHKYISGDAHVLYTFINSYSGTAIKPTVDIKEQTFTNFSPEKEKGDFLAIRSNNSTSSTMSFALTDLYIYDTTNAHTISATENIAFEKNTYAFVNSKKMTNAGDCVKFTVIGIDNPLVKINDKIIEPKNGIYSFMMPDTDVSISARERKTSLINMFADCEFKYANSISSQVPSGNSIVTEDGVNWAKASVISGQTKAYLGFVLENAGGKSWSERLLLNGRTYKVSFKAKRTVGIDFLYVFNNNYTIKFQPDKNEKSYSFEYTPTITDQIGDMLYIRSTSSESISEFQITDLQIYDITNAKIISAPENITLDKQSYTILGGKKMTNTGDSVSFTISGVENPFVKVNNTAIFPINGVYTFIMPDSDANITINKGETSLKNMFANPTFTDLSDVVSPNADTLSLTAYNDELNWVNAIKGSGDRARLGFILKNAGGTHWNDALLKAGRKYKVLFNSAALKGTSKYYVFNNNYSILIQPLTTGKKISLEYSPTVDDYINIRSNSASDNGFKVTDLYIYDITDARELISNENVLLNKNSYINIDGKKITNIGDKVSFSVIGIDNPFVKINNTVLTPINGVYTFIMPETDARINVSVPKTSLTNMWYDPEFKVNNSITTGNGKGTVTIETDEYGVNWAVASPSDDGKAAYLGFVFKDNKNWGERNLQNGRTYNISLNAKHISGDYHSIYYFYNNYSLKFKPLDTTQTFSCEYTPNVIDATNGIYNDLIYMRSTNASSGSTTKFGITDLQVYDVTDAREITTDKYVKLSKDFYTTINGKKMTNVFDPVKFSISGIKNPVVYVNGEIIKSVDDEYTFLMPEGGADITVKPNISIYENVNGIPIIYAQNTQIVYVVVFAYEKEEKVKYVESVDIEKINLAENQETELSKIFTHFSTSNDWVGKTIIVTDNEHSLSPLTDVYIK